MTEDTLRCANCGEPLPSSDAICPRCERELSVDSTVGRYRCQNCGSRFNRPNLKLWPPHAKWYMPQNLKPQCPHCEVFLRDKMVEVFISYRVVIFIFIFLPSELNARIVFLISFLILICSLHIKKVQNIIPIEEERYVIDHIIKAKQ